MGKLAISAKALIFFLISLPVGAQTVDEYKKLADQEVSKKNYPQAIEYYTKAIAIQPNSRAFLDRALAYTSSKDYRSAAEDLLSAIKYETDIKRAYSLWFLRAECLENLEQYHEALDAYLESAKIFKNLQDVADAKIRYCFNKLQDPVYEASYYTRLIESVTPKDHSYLYGMKGSAEIKAARFGLALNDLDKAISLDSTTAALFFARGQILFYKKDYKASINDFEKAYFIVKYRKLTVDSTSLAEVLLNLAFVKVVAGDETGASKALAEAAGLANEDTGIWWRIAFCHKEFLKNDGMANLVCENVILIELRTDTCHDYSFAQILSGDLDEAVANQQRLIAKYLSENNQKLVAQEQYGLAFIYSLAGETAKAFEQLDLALSRNSASTKASYENILFDLYLEPLRILPEWKTLMEKYKVPSPKW